MARKKTFRCQSCGHTQAVWAGICPQCQEGGTLQEIQAAPQRANQVTVHASAADFTNLADVKADEHERTSSGIAELDRVLGGGVVPGSLIVMAGEPGAGKTTLASEVVINLAKGGRVAYISGEESAAQARMRFERLGAKLDEINLPLSIETSIERICQSIDSGLYDLVVVDSIQTVFSEASPGAPGSVSQVRECTHQLMRAAKSSGVSVIIVGQVTTDGEMAGPRALEHLVDVVLAFEGDRREQFRILRSVKNRFGSTDEIGVFEMTETGLHGISDASGFFAPDRDKSLPGSALCTVIEGSRPVLCEIQALVEPSNFVQPIRASITINPRRMQMLLAVLSRKAGYRLGSMNVFLNVAGGLKVDEPAADLAICLAVASAYAGRPVKEGICAFGEVSLLGEVRGASQGERRRREAERLGYTALQITKGDLGAIIESALGEEVEVSCDDEAKADGDLGSVG